MIIEKGERPKARETIWQNLRKDFQDRRLQIALGIIGIVIISSLCMQRVAN